MLHAVQFTVIADKHTPDKVLESYTFTFDNFGERGTADRLTNGPRMDFVSPHEDRASMRNMVFEGKALIRRLRTMCAESPPLPSMCTLLLPIPGVITHELNRRAQLGNTCILQNAVSRFIRCAWVC